MKHTYEVIDGEHEIAVHTGRIEVYASGALVLLDHLGPKAVFASGEWTFVGRVEDDE